MRGSYQHLSSGPDERALKSLPDASVLFHEAFPYIKLAALLRRVNFLAAGRTRRIHR